jgi:hypothetical protein
MGCRNVRMRHSGTGGGIHTATGAWRRIFFINKLSDGHAVAGGCLTEEGGKWGVFVR